MKDNYLVAICKGENGETRFALQVKNISKEDFEKLLCEQRNYEEEVLKEKQDLQNQIEMLSQEILKLKEEIAYLKGEEKDEESI